jgi:hypothetical protein
MYFVANTQSGRIDSALEGMNDDNIEAFGDWSIANTNFHVVRIPDGNELTNETKWWDFSANTIMDKTEVSLTYSHTAVDKDFFSNTEIAGIADPETGLPVTIGRADAEDEPTLVLFNDFSEITVPANTSVTISDIPTDDSYIWVNNELVNTTETITVTCPAIVEIDAPQHYRKDIEIRSS